MTQHKWQLDPDMDGLLNSDDRYNQDGKAIDIFAYESGYCNGPKCMVCGYTGCHHCDKDMYNMSCPGEES